MLLVNKQWGFVNTGETYKWTNSVTFPIAIGTFYASYITPKNAPAYPIVGCTVQSTTKSNMSLKVWGTNSESRFTGFYWSIIAKA